MHDHPVIVAATGRACEGETVSGDGWVVDRVGPDCRVAVIDGLGHGPAAALATAAAVAALSSQPALGPDAALRSCHEALRGTRGAAISVARIEPEAGRLIFAGVGNVEARLWRVGGSERPIAYRGIVGVTLPRIRSFEYTLGDEWTLVLHTDGVSARFGDADVEAAIRGDPRELAELLVERWGRKHDDAMVLAARPRAGSVR